MEMIKLKHEIRDPLHGFIKISSDERDILDSLPLQRLRDIYQLGLTYLLYPSATHKRFEHSLGVMELATKVFDVVTSSENIHLGIEKSLPEIRDDEKKRYWRKVLRIAALCHDVGHLPFSHAGEKELLPYGWGHEGMTIEIIKRELASLFDELTPPVRVKDVIKLAIGPRKLLEIDPNIEFSMWETILSEIIVGDAFGVDRMDYLLRDSHHIGVAYGKLPLGVIMLSPNYMFYVLYKMRSEDVLRPIIFKPFEPNAQIIRSEILDWTKEYTNKAIAHYSLVALSVWIILTAILLLIQ